MSLIPAYLKTVEEIRGHIYIGGGGRQHIPYGRGRSGRGFFSSVKNFYNKNKGTALNYVKNAAKNYVTDNKDELKKTGLSGLSALKGLVTKDKSGRKDFVANLKGLVPSSFGDIDVSNRSSRVTAPREASPVPLVPLNLISSRPPQAIAPRPSPPADLIPLNIPQLSNAPQRRSAPQLQLVSAPRRRAGGRYRRIRRLRPLGHGRRRYRRGRGWAGDAFNKYKGKALSMAKNAAKNYFNNNKDQLIRTGLSGAKAFGNMVMGKKEISLTLKTMLDNLLFLVLAIFSHPQMKMLTIS